MLQKEKCQVDVAFLPLGKNYILEVALKHPFSMKKLMSNVVKSKKSNYICTPFITT